MKCGWERKVKDVWRGLLVADLPVVAWRGVGCPVDAAGLLVLSIGPDTARRKSQLFERQKSNLDGVWDCF